MSSNRTTTRSQALLSGVWIAATLTGCADPAPADGSAGAIVHLVERPEDLLVVDPPPDGSLPIALDATRRCEDLCITRKLGEAPVGEEIARRITARLQCGDDRRLCWWLPAPCRLEIAVTFRTGDRLRFGVGAQAPTGGLLDGWVECALSFQPDGATPPTALGSFRFTADAVTWQDHELSVPPEAACSGTLRLVVTGEGSAAAGAAIANPRILPPTRAHRGPNVIVYLVDTLRRDSLSCYGNPLPTSPHLDAIAAQGYLFEDAYAVASWTRPTVASLFTSLYPVTHGSTQMESSLPLTPATLAETFQAAGYSTWAYVSTRVVSDPALRYDQGFHRFATRSDGRSSDAAQKDTARWLAEHGNEPFFLYLHTLDPHSPYTPPEEVQGTFADPFYRGPLAGLTLSPLAEADRLDWSALGEADLEYLRDRYLEEVLYQDQRIGELWETLEEQGRLDDTVLLILSDHGEEFREHGGFEHRGSMWEELLRIPMILWLPPRWRDGLRPAPDRVRGPISQVDVLPALAELAGISCAGPVQGSSFLPWLRAPREPHAPAYFEETRRLGALARWPWKLIWRRDKDKAEILQLYRLDEDPGEQQDVADQFPQVMRRLLASRAALRAEHAAAVPDWNPEDEAALDPATVEQLKELGYLGSNQ